MSRSEYTEDSSNDWATIMWRGAVKSALKGRRGQIFLTELLGGMDALPEKRLIDNALEVNGEYCAIGVVGLVRGMDMGLLDPHDWGEISECFDIAEAMVREVVFMNDECSFSWETPEQRWRRMREWVKGQITQGDHQ